MTEKKLHSAAYFGDQRDFWWHRDFLAIMAERWQLANVKTLLDVGSGQGHWSLVLFPFLHDEATVVGVEPEEKWREIAFQHAARFQLQDRVQYLPGTAEKLPFEDNTFDMVTCQTVLIHVADPIIALQEMKRVLKPGGLLACVEPNNAVPGLLYSNVNWDQPVDEFLAYAKFQLICERGKEALGEGNNTRGDLLPYYLSKVQLKDISSYLSDMADYLIPPYDSPREKAVVQGYHNLIEGQHYLWDKEDTFRYFIAGNGTPELFETFWQQAGAAALKIWEAMQRNDYYCPGGAVFYLTAGRKQNRISLPAY